MPTKQETFDTVVAHLRKQAAKAIRSDIGCCYRSPEGLKCAAGCLIPDDLYSPNIENGKVIIGAITPRVPLQSKAVTELIASLGHNVRLVADLQDTHDYLEVDEWEDSFRTLALKHGLTYTPPT